MFRTLAFLLMTCTFAVVLSAQEKKDQPAEKIDGAKLIGKWLPPEDKKAPEGAYLEFTKDGKLFVQDTKNGKTTTEEMGSFKLEGNKIKFSPKQKADFTVELTIEKLTDTELAISEGGKKADIFKRKK